MNLTKDTYEYILNFADDRTILKSFETMLFLKESLKQDTLSFRSTSITILGQIIISKWFITCQS